MQQQLFKVRDLRKKDQFKIDDIYLNGYAKILGVCSTAVYSSLARHAEFYSQKAFPSEELIAKEHNITTRTVRTAIKKLKIANIIKVEKTRSVHGKWLNNTYFLLDKSEWKQPEELNSLWKPRGIKRQQPEELKVSTRGIKRPIKDNTLRRITNKKDNKLLATKEVAGKDFNLLIESFKTINPSYERLFSNKTQRGALERLVKKFGLEKVQNMINYLPKIFGKPYAPVICTPYELEKKLPNLMSYIQSEKLKKPKYIKIS